MLSIFVIAALMASAGAQRDVTLAKTWTGWDCCKPACTAINNNRNLLDSRGIPRVCDRYNNPLSTNDAISAQSGCSNGGSAFLCENYQPVPVSEDLAYGFAIQVGGSVDGNNPNCCKCLEVDWLSGGAEGKKMIVQVVTPGRTGGDVKDNDLILLIPGGGVGPFGSGCERQYGGDFNWGSSYGGVNRRESCERLPSSLQGGCYWRFNWADGEVNGWDVVYRQVECPSRLTDITGCSA